MAVERVLNLYNGLRSYFASESCPQVQYLRLQALFTNLLSEVYLLFYQSVLPVFNHFNFHPFGTRSLSEPFEESARQICTNWSNQSSSLSEVNINIDSQLSDRHIFIDFLTSQTLARLENEGDVSPLDSRKFYWGVRQFYAAAFEYIIAKFPLRDDVLQHTQNLMSLTSDKVANSVWCQLLHGLLSYCTWRVLVNRETKRKPRPQ